MLYEGNNILGESLLFPTIETCQKKLALKFTKFSPRRYLQKNVVSKIQTVFLKKNLKIIMYIFEESRSGS